MHTTIHTRPRRAFTLIEMLVVIGIVVLLGGLLLGAVARSYKAGIRTRALADITLISTALEAYHADFLDYPRFDNDGSGNTLNTTNNRGAVLLCRALIAPGPALLQGAGTFGQDGADGNGFRTRPGGAGTVYGPYVQPDKFKLGGKDTTNYSDATILDRFGNPILYLPATIGATNLTTDGGYVDYLVPPVASGTTLPLYNSYDVNNASSTFAMGALLTILNVGPTGAVNTTGSNVSPTYTGPYILWSAGPDGIFGLDQNKKTDDITNFDIPPNFRK